MLMEPGARPARPSQRDDYFDKSVGLRRTSTGAGSCFYRPLGELVPPAVIAVDPQVFLDACVTCADIADLLWSALDSASAKLASTGSMAGSDDGARDWGTHYDSSVTVLFNLSNSIVAAVSNYAMLLRQAGANHETAEAAAAGMSADTEVRLSIADSPGGVAVPPSAIGDSGPGMQGAIDLASAVGVPCPNGDTGKLRDAARAWAVFESETRNSRRSLLGVAGQLFDKIDSPEIAGAYRELRQIAQSCESAAAASGCVSRACFDHADQLDDSRNEIRSAIERFAVEEVAAIAVGIGLAWLTVGVSAAASAAIAAGRFTSAAHKVRKLIDALNDWRRSRGPADDPEISWQATKLDEIAQRPKIDLDDLPVRSRDQLPGESGTVTPQQTATEYNTRPERLDHTFADKHGLDEVTQQAGGRENTIRDILSELDDRALRTGMFEEIVAVQGIDVTVRGAVVNGVIKIGTAYIP